MRDGVGAGLAGDLDQPFGNERSRDRGAEQVIPLVTGVGAHHREDEIAHELLAQIVNVDVLGLDAHQFGFGAGRRELFALSEIGGEGHDLAVIGYLQPLEDHARVEAARVGEDYSLDFRALDVRHGPLFLGERESRMSAPLSKTGGRGKGRERWPRRK